MSLLGISKNNPKHIQKLCPWTRWGLRPQTPERSPNSKFATTPLREPSVLELLHLLNLLFSCYSL